MIEVVLELMRAGDESVVRKMVRDRGSFTVTGPDVPPLLDRKDIDTVLLEDWPAVEWFRGRPPRTLGWVTVDAFSASRVLLYEATITALDSKSVPQSAAVSWVMSMPHYAPARLADSGNPDAVREAELSYIAIPDEEADYPRFLNAFEVIERHNANGSAPPIHKVGIQAIIGWMPSLLHAYDTYESRALTGAYDPKDHTEGHSSG